MAPDRSNKGTEHGNPESGEPEHVHLDLGEDGVHPSLKTRLIAWWEGYDLSALKKRHHDHHDEALGDGHGADSRAGGSASAPPIDPAKARPGELNRWGKPLWTANRIAVAEKIWGPGFVSPGGNDFFPYLLKPLGLNPAMTVLDLSAGLGGSTRAMAGQFGAWAVGMEPSPQLAEAGMARSVKAGMSKQAPVEHYDAEDFYYPKRVDAVFAKELFYLIHKKDHLLDNVRECLKGRGQFLFTDYVVEDPKLKTGLKTWADHESQEPSLWTVQETAKAMAKRAFDVRITEDITETHRGMILTAIQALTDHLEKHHLDPETKRNVVDEVEVWARRVAALHAGLRCYRFYALKTGD